MMPLLSLSQQTQILQRPRQSSTDGRQSRRATSPMALEAYGAVLLQLCVCMRVCPNVSSPPEDVSLPDTKSRNIF